MFRATNRNLSSRQAAIESLEGRSLMSASFVTQGSVSLLNNGVVTIQGTAYADRVDVNLDTNGTASTADDKVSITLNTPSAPFLKKVTKTFAASKLKKINFYARQSDDTFINDSKAASTVLGGDGNDLLVGGSSDDLLLGQNGYDRLYGRYGTDTLLGGKGNDYLDTFHGYHPSEVTLAPGIASEIAYGDEGLDVFRTNKIDVTDRKAFEMLF